MNLKTTTLIFVLVLFILPEVRAQQNRWDEIENTGFNIKNTLNSSWTVGSADELQKAFGKAVLNKEKDEELTG